MTGFIVSRLLGLVRNSLLAASFGNGPAADAFNAAFAIPDFTFNLIVGGALNAALIPIFAELYNQGKSRDAWQLVSITINIIVALLTICAALAALAAPLLVHLIAPSSSLETQHLVVQLTRILSLQPIFFGIGAVAIAVLNARHHFLFPAWAPVIYNVCQILALWKLVPIMGINGLAIGVVAGALTYALLLLIPLHNTGLRYQRLFNWRNRNFRQMLHLLLPRTLTLSLNQLGSTVTTRTLASAIPGGIAALTYALPLLQMPVNTIGVSIATAAFPTLSELGTHSQYAEMRERLRRWLDTMAYLGFGIGAIVAALSTPIVAVILQRGAFTAADTALTAGVLVCFIWGLAAQLTDELLPRAFFALKDTRTPLLINVIIVACNITLSITLRSRFGIAGIAAALSIAATIEALLLLVTLNRRLSGLLSLSLLTTYAKLTFAAIAVSMLTHLLASGVDHLPGPTMVHLLLAIVIAGSSGAVTYAWLCSLLGIHEHAWILQRLSVRWPILATFFKQQKSYPHTSSKLRRH